MKTSIAKKQFKSVVIRMARSIKELSNLKKSPPFTAPSAPSVKRTSLMSEIEYLKIQLAAMIVSQSVQQGCGYVTNPSNGAILSRGEIFDKINRESLILLGNAFFWHLYINSFTDDTDYNLRIILFKTLKPVSHF